VLVVNEFSVGVSGQPGDLGAGSCASGDKEWGWGTGEQSGSQFPKEDERLPGGMHWRPYFGVDTDVDRLLWSFAANEGQTNG